MSRKSAEADGDINEFMEFFKSSPCFYPHNAKHIDSDSQFHSTKSNQQITCGNCITSSSDSSIPAAYHLRESALPTATIDRGVTEEVMMSQQMWNTPHNILNSAVTPAPQHPTAALSQSSDTSSPGDHIPTVMGKAAEIRNPSVNGSSLPSDTSQNTDQTRLRALLWHSSTVHNEGAFNVADTRDANIHMSTIEQTNEHPQEMRSNAITASTDKEGNHNGIKDIIHRFVGNGISGRSCMEVGANEVVSHLHQQRNDVSFHSDKTDERQSANLSQSDVTPIESTTHVQRAAHLASNYPILYAVPVSQLQLTAPTVQATYTSSTVPVMPALMRTSVQLLSLVPGSLLRCPSPMVDSQLQPLNLSRDISARSLCQPSSTFPTAIAQTPCNNSRRTCADGQADMAGEGVNVIKERLPLEGMNDGSHSRFVLHSSASAFPLSMNGQTRKDPVECLTPCKRPVVRTLISKRQIAPNITVRTLPIGTVIVGRKIKRVSKYERTDRDSQRRILSMPSPITPTQSPLEESVDEDREKAVGKRSEMIRSDDSSSWDRNAKYGNCVDKNNNGAENNNNERGTTSKKRRQRLNNAQKLTLEEHFETNRYPSKQTIATICEMSGLAVTEVRRWFVNRRRRERARVKLQREVTPPFISPPSSESQDSGTENSIKKIIID